MLETRDTSEMLKLEQKLYCTGAFLEAFCLEHFDVTSRKALHSR